MEDRILVLAEPLLTVQDFLHEPGLFCVCGEVQIIGKHDSENPADGHIGGPGAVDEDIQDRGSAFSKPVARSIPRSFSTADSWRREIGG